MVIGALVLIVAGVVFFLTVIAQNGKVQVRLGDDRFDAGKATEMAKLIAKDGPVKYADASGRQRDIMVNHVGPSPEEGWIAFEIRRPGDARTCQIDWSSERQLFTYSCDPNVTFPPDGAGLQPFPVEVISGNVIVDLNAEARATTSASTTAPTFVITGK